MENTSNNTHTYTNTETNTDDPVQVRCEFTGSGSEYFRIWIVNLALTALTLGIYSAWAKVRSTRYFYGCTHLDGDPFEYHAQPIQILKGRLIAVTALVTLFAAQSLFPVIGAALTLVLLACLPLIIVRALRFRTVMSSWRGIRFGFQGTAAGAARAYLLWPLIGLLTLGFGLPYVWLRQNHFTFNNLLLGSTPAQSTTEAGDFYTIFWALTGVGLAGYTVFFVTALLSNGTSNGTDAAVLILPAYLLVYLAGYALFQAMYHRVVYNNIRLDQTSLHNDLRVRTWIGIVLTNTVLLILTLGVYYPWARVRLTGYMLTSTWVNSPDLTTFSARQADEATALGEELGEAFDIGITV